MEIRAYSDTAFQDICDGLDEILDGVYAIKVQGQLVEISPQLADTFDHELRLLADVSGAEIVQS